MKKILTLLAVIALFVSAQAQNSTMENTRRVATRGFAEKEVTPDIIFLSISLKEYYDNGNTKKKVAIDILEKQLFESAMKNGVKKEDFTIQNMYSYNSSEKKKNNELLQARQYRIKVTNLNNLNAMMEALDAEGLQSTSITGYDHSQKKTIEKELKTIAMKDARTNAEILAAAEDDTIGKVLMINDNSSFNWESINPSPRMYSMAKTANLESADSMEQGLELDIRPIKLSCQIDVVFEIK